MNFPLEFQIICSGIIAGLILLQTIIIAPSVFKILKPLQIRDLLRSIFPKLFLFIAILGFISLLLTIVFGTHHRVQIIVNLTTIIFSLFCFYIIPMTNKAKDEENNKLFSFLHKISVYSTMLVLIINLFWIVLL